MRAMCRSAAASLKHGRGCFSGTAGGEATNGDVLASLRSLRATLAKETEEANSTAASRDKVRTRAST